MANIDAGAGESIGYHLRVARQRLGLTQQELARRAGLSIGALRDLEQGRSRYPRGRSIRALAEMLELGPEHHARLQALALRPRSEPVAPAGPVRIGVLGPLAVSRSGAPVPVGAGRHRVVLARLALTPNRPVSTAELMRLLWSGEPPATAPNVLQTHVSRLRHLLETGQPAGSERMLRLTPGGYCLQAEDDEVDLLTYRRHLARARQASAVDPQRAFDLLHDALDLWRGHSAVEDVSELHGDPLVTAAGDELVEAAIRLGQLGESLRRLPEVLPRLRALAAVHLWHERLYARLIIALAASGQQAAALGTFDAIRRRLADELGIDPGAELVDARQAVLDRRWESKGPARLDNGGARAVLPPPPVDFTGRVEPLQRLEHLLRSALRRTSTQPPSVCVISGMPGVGKTSLALRAVQAVRPELPENPLYIDLRGADDQPVGVADALSRLLRALGVDGRRVPDDPEQARVLYRDVLAERQVLIVLDNARDAAHVRPLLPERGASAVLVTSRNECSELVPALHLALPVLSVAEAVELLACRIGSVRVSSDPAAATALVEACGRLPIALRVVDRRLANDRGLTLGALLDDLHRSQRDRPGIGDPAVEASFDLSYRQLDERSARVFRAGSLVPGDTFTAPAAAAVAGEDATEVERTLHRLAEQNLVQVLDSGRYRYHDLLHAYAGRRLTEEQDPVQRSAALGRLCEWYLTRTAAAMRLVYASMVRLPTDVDDRPVCFDGVDAAHAWLDEEVGSLIAVIEAVARGEHSNRSWELADQLRGYFFIHRDIVRWLASGRAGLAAAERAGDRRAQAAMHQTIGQAYWSVGRHDLALTSYQRGATAAAESGWTVGQAYLAHNLGLVHAELGHVAEAQRLYREALSLGDGPEFTHIRAVTLNDLGALCNEQGRLTEAVEHFSAALRINSSASRRQSAMANRNNLGMVLRQLERFDEAHEHLTAALDYDRGTGSLSGQMSILDELSHLHRQRGALSSAVDTAEEALRIAVQLDNLRAQAAVRNTLGLALLAARAVTDARAQFDLALQLSRERGYPHIEAQAGVGIAESALADGANTTAGAAAGEALRIAQSRDYRVLVGDASAVLARVALATDDLAAAEAHHDLARRSYATGGLPGKLRELDRLGEQIARRARARP